MKKLFAIGIIIAAAWTTSAQAGHVRHRHLAAAAPAKIACTVIGCLPVPRQCGQTQGRTLDGSPTGFDIIVCPPGVAPLR